MKHIFTLVGAVLLLFSGTLAAQQEAEVGLQLGVVNYQGDLVPVRISVNHSGFDVGVNYRQLFTHKWALRGSLHYGRIHADDRDYPSRVGRGAVMEARLLEISTVGEWHPLGKARYNLVGRLHRNISPFVYVGIGLAVANAEVNFTGEKVVLQEEEQNTYFVLPAGAGLRFHISERLTLTADVGTRPVFSDHLDGVSANGNSTNNDWYLRGGLTVLYSLAAGQGW